MAKAMRNAPFYIGLFVSLYAHADIYRDAAPLMDPRDTIVRLTPEHQSVLQAYFDRINAQLDFPDEVGLPKPKVILFDRRDSATLAYVVPKHPEFVFWSVRLLLSSPSGDIDRMVMAHERRHFSKFNQNLEENRAVEYDADLSLYRRLFRIGLRDPRTKEPQAALVHFDTLMDWLRSQEGERGDYIDCRALGSLALATYAKERLVRRFPERPASRDVLFPVIRAARAFIATQLARLQHRFLEFDMVPRGGRSVFGQSATILARVAGDAAGALLALDHRRVTHADAGPELIRELNQTLGQIDVVWRKASPADRIATFEKMAHLSDTFFTAWTPLHKAYHPTPRDDYDLVPAFANADAVLEYLGRESREFNELLTLLGTARLVPSLGEDGGDSTPSRLILASAMIKLAREHLGPTYEPLARLDARLDARLRRDATSPEFGAALDGFLADLINPERKTLNNFVRLFGTVPPDAPVVEIVARHLLPRLPMTDEFMTLRTALGHGPKDLASVLSLGRSDPRQLLTLLTQVRAREPNLYARWGLNEVWLRFLEQRRESKDPYVPGLDEAMAQLVDQVPKTPTPSVLKAFEDHLSRDPEAQRAAAALTEIIANDPLAFVTAWTRDGLRPVSAILMVTRWPAVLAAHGSVVLARLIEAMPKVLTLDTPTFQPVQEAFATRLRELIDEARDPGAMDLSIRVLRTTPSTSPAGQRLLNTVLAGLRADRTAAGRAALLDFLRHVSLLNFRETRAFVTLYTDVLFDAADVDLGVEIALIKDHFDPVTANAILLRLAERTHALPAEKANFTFTEADVAFNPDDPLRLMRELMKHFSFDDGLDLLMHLREGGPVPTRYIPKLQQNFLSLGFPLRAADLVRELREVHEDLGFDRQHELTIEWNRRHLVSASGRPEMSWARNSLTSQEARAAERLDADISAKLATGEYTQRTRDRRVRRPGRAAEEFHVWYAVTKELLETQVQNLMDFLRSNAPLSDALRLELQIRLSRAKIAVRSVDVEDYVRRQYALLKPLQRAAVFQLLLDGNERRLESAEFRDATFRRIFDRIPDDATRATFIDLWEAGLAAWPKRLHTFVLSVILSESGSVGSPEQALVTMLSHMGPLEQKFGQMLAFADIPDSYRRALRTLWDGAQSLGWWDAWDLISVQVGDIQRAGYRLTRILNSGSTMAYLEITHRGTGRRLVIPVYRDGVRRSVEVGAEELRTFARTLVAKNAARYGFLPLLVEDSVRTMEAELDPRHKERMTGLMAEAYRRAARVLGWSVTDAGRMENAGWAFTNLPYEDLDLGDGKIVRAQEIADGEPLSLVKDSDPALYTYLTDVLLKLEHAVLGDSTAPVDKDRMPGQFIVNLETRTVYILDHGQARVLDPRTRAMFAEFTRRGFTDDITGMARLLEELTGVRPPVESLGDRVTTAEAGLKPLVFLNEVSAPYLALPEGPAKNAFFNLLHGVRARLRVLQWDQSEGSGHLINAARAEALGAMSLPQALAAAARLAKPRVDHVRAESIDLQLARMHRAMGEEPPRSFVEGRGMSRSSMIPTSYTGCEWHLLQVDKPKR